MKQVTSALADYRARAALFWQARSEQEQRMLSICAAVVGLALVYSVLIAPAVTGRVKLQQDLPELRRQAAELQALAQQAVDLKGQNSAPPAPMSHDSLVASLATQGLTAQSVSMTGEYAKLQFSGVSFPNLMTWLAAQRNDNRIAVLEASITAQNAAGVVDATLTLRQGGQK